MVYFFILLFCELIAISLFYECYPSRGNSTTWRGIFLDTSRAARQNMNILPCDSNGSQQFNIFLMDMDTCDYIRPFNKAYFITCKYICCIKTVMNMTVYHTWNHVLLDNVSRIFFLNQHWHLVLERKLLQVFSREPAISWGGRGRIFWRLNKFFGDT